jgi:hypothetical protein
MSTVKIYKLKLFIPFKGSGSANLLLRPKADAFAKGMPLRIVFFRLLP